MENSSQSLHLFELGQLPFDEHAFEPKLSAESFAFHYNKHHKAYVDNLAQLLTSNVLHEYGMNASDLLLAQAAWSGKNISTVHDLSLIYIMRKSYQASSSSRLESVLVEFMSNSSANENANEKQSDVIRSDLSLNLHKRIFNNAAQHWNHAFFWQSITHEEKNVSSKLVSLIEKTWGSIEGFKKAFYDMGTKLFGSGWVWLVFDKQTESLALVPTINAETPVVFDRFVPLLVCDVWEHAYYIDYRNKRIDYLDYIIGQLDWQFADENFNGIK